MNNKKPCQIKPCLISVLAVFIFLNFYGWLVHGHLLMDDYKATANLWRSEAEMEKFGPLWLVYYVLLAMVVTCFFKKFRKGFSTCHCGPECACGENCPCKKAVADGNSRCPIKSGGVCFGIKLGLIMGLGMSCSYLYIPMPAALAIKWFFAGFFEGLGMGVVLGMTCKSQGCSTTACDAKKS